MHKAKDGAPKLSSYKVSIHKITALEQPPMVDKQFEVGKF